YWDISGETPEQISQVIQASIDMGIDRYVFHYAGVEASDVSRQQAIAAVVESMGDRGQFIAMTQDPNAIASGSSADIGSVVQGLTYNRTTVIYHPATVTRVVDGEI